MLTPIKLKVLILPDGKKTETASGIYTGALSVEGATRRGTVVSVGSQVKELKEGMRVFYLVQSGHTPTYDGVEYALMFETEVLGILNDEN